MLNRHNTLKHAWIFNPLVFLIFIWPYAWSPGLNLGLQAFGAWRFVLATLAIGLSAALFFRDNWVGALGLPKRARQYFACAIAGILAFVVFYFFINFVLENGGYHLQPFTEAGRTEYFGRYPLLSWTLLRICQPLNEEIVLRALLLGFFARFFTNRAYLAIIAALVFSALHLLFYYAGPMTVQLDLLALLTLFFFAIAANSLYLTFNHIGFGFVIHLAWNWWRFSGDLVKDGVVLNEAQTFNAIEGSSPVFIFVVVLSLACVFGLLVHEAKVRRKLVKY